MIKLGILLDGALFLLAGILIGIGMANNIESDVNIGFSFAILAALNLAVRLTEKITDE